MVPWFAAAGTEPHGPDLDGGSWVRKVPRRGNVCVAQSRGVMSRRKLTPGALAFRAAHGAIAAAFLLAISYVWWCALTGRRGRLLRVAVTALGCEGALVAANHGDCPLGPLQQRAGDPVPLFELVLSPRAARLGCAGPGSRHLGRRCPPGAAQDQRSAQRTS